MKKHRWLSKWSILPVVVVELILVLTIGFTMAAFNDPETSNGSSLAAWTSTSWTQTSQAEFEAGVLSNVNTTSSPGDVLLSIVSNPTLVTSNNTEVSTSTGGLAWDLVKTLNFTKSGSSYNQLRIDTNLKSLNSWDTVSSSLRLNDVEIFTHSTSSTTYVTYNDTFDFSGYADGPYTLKLYLQVDGGTGYSQLFEVYTTSPVLLGADNSEVNATGDTSFQLKKTLNFTKSGSGYSNLRFETNLRATGGTASYRIDLNDVPIFTNSTTSSTYVTFTDLLDFSGYADGPYTVKLYLQISNKNKIAYNSLFQIYRVTPVLVASDDTEKSITYSSWQLMKTLEFTKTGLTYNELRIDNNLHATSPATASSSIRIDDVEVATHSTTSGTYVAYSDVINTSALSDSSHTVKLYMMSSNSKKGAYNSTFEVYRTQTYAASGTVASQVRDTTVTGSRGDGLVWGATLPSGTGITLEARASDTAFLKTDASPSWTAVGGTSPVIAGLPSGRYKQWRATLTPNGAWASTPSLQEARLYYYGN